MDKKLFYDEIRPHVNLTTQNVMGMEKVLDYALARSTALQDLAYIIATAWWETGQTMQPVVEAFYISSDFKKAEAWRKKNLRYYPWHGRGLIQTTWEANYKKMSPIVGTDLIKRPDALLEWQYALPALFVGMEKGLYTGKALSDYIDNLDESDAEDLREFTNARRIVNGTDKAAKIGQLALVFEDGLLVAGYDPTKRPVIVDRPQPPLPPVITQPPSENVPEPTGVEVSAGFILTMVGLIVLALLAAWYFGVFS